MPAEGDQQAVAADLDVSGLNDFKERQDAQRDFQFRRFIPSHRQETGILKRCGPRGLCHCSVQRSQGRHIADTSTKLAPQVKGGESTSMFGQVR